MIRYVVLSACFVICIGGQLRGRLEKPIDLGHSLDENTLYWSNTSRFHFTDEISVRRNNSYYAMKTFESAEHGGTHVDAPLHFKENGTTVGRIPLEKLIVPGIVVDITNDVEKNGCGTQLKPSHLEKWIKRHGEIPKNGVILVKTGWSKKYPNRTEYFGITDENPEVYCFPGVSEEAAQWIVDNNKAVGVGIDVASIDPGNSTTFGSHRILQGNELYLIENLNLTPELPAKGFTLFVMPMKIEEGTGAPARIIAI